MSPMCSPDTYRPDAPISARCGDPLGMSHGVLGRDPSTDAMADEREAVEPQRVEHLAVVKQEVFDPVALPEFGRAVAGGMRGRDQPASLRQSLMERQQVALDAMDIRKPVQIDQGRTRACFNQRDLAPFDIDLFLMRVHTLFLVFHSGIVVGDAWRRPIGLTAAAGARTTRSPGTW